MLKPQHPVVRKRVQRGPTRDCEAVDSGKFHEVSASGQGDDAGVCGRAGASDDQLAADSRCLLQDPAGLGLTVSDDHRRERCLYNREN